VENTSFGEFSTSLHCQDLPAVVGGILVSCRLAAIFAVLEPTLLLYLRILQAKVQATPQANLAALCLSIASEWDWLAVDYIH
jgi:hypothetical protein